MFHKLKRQLTLYILAILTAVMMIIAIFAFIGSASTNIGKVTEAMWNIALTGTLPDNVRHERVRNNQGRCILIDTDINGLVTDVSSQVELPSDIYTQLASKVIMHKDSSGQVSCGNYRFIFLRFIEQANAGAKIILQEDITLGQALCSYFSRVTPILIISLLLIYLASMAITARALIPIRKAWKRQTEFTGDASHELRTPIAVIQANLDVVMDEPEQSVLEKEKWLDNIKAETNRMQKLVEDLLTLSRTDEEQLTLEKNFFSIKEALSTSIEPLIPYAKSKGIELCSDVSSNIQFMGDMERIKQLVVILLDNAIKHTPAGGEICIKSELQNHNLSIIVKDNGEGMEPEHLSKIFDRFYRVDKARSLENGGSGLGLSIAKWIAEEHGGRIRVTSTVNVGSTFEVILPLKKPQPV